MPNIKVLPKDVRNLIAAGEVVERPASVVKELVENAIDADASEIRVEVENGGTSRIVVTDDGVGMDAEDIRLCVSRHATSKLKEAHDLTAIGTMGFRGEALPSIAAVSKMNIESGVRGSDNTGHIFHLEGGEEIAFEEKGTASGTKITVSDLFYNVPARKKFTRTPRTELGHIKEMVQKLALANPEIRFQLISDGRELLNASSVKDQRQRAFEVLGSDVIKESYLCRADAGEIRVYGLVGDPSLAREGSGGIYWFVNRRPIRDRLLNHAINEAYRSLLPKGYIPFSMLFISMSPELVDVNVHPTKSEVRFLKGSAVHDFVVSAVKKALGTRDDVAAELHLPAVALADADASQNSGRIPCRPNSSDRIPTARRSLGGGGWRPKINVPTTTCDQAELVHLGPFSSLRTIGQLQNSYLLCERVDGGLVIIDQHAAHERIGYERLKENYAGAKVQSQRLLIPEVVTVVSKNVGYLESALDRLNEIGWEIEYFGGDNFCVKSVPAILGNVNLKVVVASIADDLSEYDSLDSHDEKIDFLMKISACHAQVRAGDKLTNSEIQYLLNEMDKYDWSGRCPHGRPAVAEFTIDELGKLFNR